MNKVKAKELVKRLVMKGDVFSAQIVCYDYNLPLSLIDEVGNENKEERK